MTKYQIRVMDLNSEEIELLRKSRAEWGHEKYGDSDELRDGSLDMLEEVMDIKNILERRIMWFNKYFDLINHEKYESIKRVKIKSETIKRNCEMLICHIREFDRLLRNTGYEVNDSNGGERVGLDYLEYCKTAAESHKEL